MREITSDEMPVHSRAPPTHTFAPTRNLANLPVCMVLYRKVEKPKETHKDNYLTTFLHFSASVLILVLLMIHLLSGPQSGTALINIFTHKHVTDPIKNEGLVMQTLNIVF